MKAWFGNVKKLPTTYLVLALLMLCSKVAFANTSYHTITITFNPIPAKPYAKQLIAKLFSQLSTENIGRLHLINNNDASQPWSYNYNTGVLTIIINPSDDTAQ